MSKIINNRSTEYNIDDIFLERYSPRAMSGENVSKNELMTLFESARWAPSASNIQPWRFIYANREMPEFEIFLSFLKDANKVWCEKAGALIIMLSKKTSDSGVLSPKHSFDAGAAWENLALQAVKMNLVCHAMAGIYFDLIKEKLSIPDDYEVEIMIAIGKKGKIEDLPEPLQARETPSNRKPLEEIVFEGKFRG
ncbi:MAG: nitroreductase family protein [Minisyncoccia bacterium]